jgi:hypothetical protein
MEPKLRYMFLKPKLTGTKVNWHVTPKFEPSPKSRTHIRFLEPELHFEKRNLELDSLFVVGTGPRNK